MYNRRLWIYAVVISLALIGLLVVQFLWIKNSVSITEEKFKKDISFRLKGISEKLESDQLCFENFYESTINVGEEWFLLKPQYDSAGNYILDTLTAHFWDGYGQDTLYSSSKYEAPLPTAIQVSFRYEFLLDEELKGKDSTELSDMDEWLINSYDNVITHDEEAKSMRIIDTVYLKNELEKSFADLGSGYKNYEFLVYNVYKNDVIYSSAPKLNSKIITSDTYTYVFKGNKFLEPLIVYVYFPTIKAAIYKSLWFILLISFVVIIVLALLFGVFIRAAIKQEKLDLMKTDFINNMTHEFNTPVANINLALDTIGKQSSYSENLSDDKILDIIREENRRLKENIDTILQTSILGKEGVMVRKESVDINSLIEKVIDVFALTLSTTKGSIDVHYKAKRYVIEADEVHLTNMLYNLIDNAIKYSTEKPAINVYTTNTGSSIKITVKDKGMGMTKDELKKVFDRFYRVSTGARHDVKGFGLGLAYVKSIVDAHKGSIEVHTAKGQGSEFVITLPIQ